MSASQDDFAPPPPGKKARPPAAPNSQNAFESDSSDDDMPLSVLKSQGSPVKKEKKAAKKNSYFNPHADYHWNKSLRKQKRA